MGQVVRHPVKSMAGEACAAAAVGWRGLDGDRAYAFVKRGDASGFPWLTGRDVAAMVLHRARFDDPDGPRRSGVAVRTPAGEEMDVRDPALRDALAEAAGVEVDLLRVGAGAHDLMPVSVVTTASLAALDALHGSGLDRRRFRANLVVDGREDGKWGDERDWAGRRVRLGDGEDAAELLIAAPAPRCAMVTIDPDTGARDPSVLRTVARGFGAAFTMYASVARPGVVREGDAVRFVDG